MYHNDNLTIRNCEIYNSSAGIYLKSDNDNTHIYNNYIYDCYQGILITTFLEQSSDNISIYNNIISNIGYTAIQNDGEEESHSNNMKIYNNTLYNYQSRGVTTGQCVSGYGAEVYNNIFESATSSSDLATGYTRSTVAGYLKAVDHNLWTPDFSITARANGGHTYASLSTWQSSGELNSRGNPGLGSLSSNPLFVNGSSKMNKLDDFRLASNSPCKKAGRNGEDIGANIDLVGPSGIKGTIGEPPEPPRNLRIMPN